jgi:hydrogenase maturation protease
MQGTLPDDVDVLEREGEPSALIAAWEGANALWLVDAVSSDAPPGTVHRLDASHEPLPVALFRTSTHHLGLPDAVELARTLGRLPARTVVFGVEGASFAAGNQLTPDVEAAVGRVIETVKDEVRAYTHSERSRPSTS